MLSSFSARAYSVVLLCGHSRASVENAECGPRFRKNGMKHIGKLIAQELRHQERTVSWFARNLCCERTNVYDIFKRRSIDTQMLLRISNILGHNFFLYYEKEYEHTERQ